MVVYEIQFFYTYYRSLKASRYSIASVKLLDSLLRVSGSPRPESGVWSLESSRAEANPFWDSGSRDRSDPRSGNRTVSDISPTAFLKSMRRCGGSILCHGIAIQYEALAKARVTGSTRSNNTSSSPEASSNSSTSKQTFKMSGYGGGGAPRVRKIMTQAINLIFEFLKNVRVMLPSMSTGCHQCGRKST